VYGALSAGQRSGVTSVQATAVTSSGLKLKVFLHGTSSQLPSVCQRPELFLRATSDNTDSVDVDAPFPFPVSNDTEVLNLPGSCFELVHHAMQCSAGPLSAR